MWRRPPRYRIRGTVQIKAQLHKLSDIVHVLLRVQAVQPPPYRLPTTPRHWVCTGHSAGECDIGHTSAPKRCCIVYTYATNSGAEHAVAGRPTGNLARPHTTRTVRAPALGHSWPMDIRLAQRPAVIGGPAAAQPPPACCFWRWLPLFLLHQGGPAAAQSTQTQTQG